MKPLKNILIFFFFIVAYIGHLLPDFSLYLLVKKNNHGGRVQDPERFRKNQDTKQTKFTH
jgi:hypothetical protein